MSMRLGGDINNSFLYTLSSLAQSKTLHAAIVFNFRRCVSASPLIRIHIQLFPPTLLAHTVSKRLNHVGEFKNFSPSHVDETTFKTVRLFYHSVWTSCVNNTCHDCYIRKILIPCLLVVPYSS